MTVVIGFNWGTEVVGIADTRVSWTDGERPPRDVLRKLYLLGDENKSAALGFCGSIEGARAVMTFLMEQKFRQYGRRFVIAQFKDQLRGWIEEISAKLPPEQRRGLCFLLCGVEPSRRPAAFKDMALTAGGAPFIEPHIYKLCVGSDGRVRMNARSAPLAIIGSGRSRQQEIGQKVRETMRFGFAQQNLHWARAFLIANVISALFRQPESPDVGGLFEVVRIAQTGVDVQYVWPSDSGFDNVVVTNHDDAVSVRNPALNETRTLYPVWASLPL